MKYYADKEPFKTFMGWNIFVREDGTFVGRPPGDGTASMRHEITRKDLKGLEREIAKRQKGDLHVMQFRVPGEKGRMYTSEEEVVPKFAPLDYHIGSTERTASRGMQARLTDGRMVPISSEWYVYDAAVVAKVEEFAARRKVLLEELAGEYRAWIATLTLQAVGRDTIDAQVAASASTATEGEPNQ